MAYLISIQNQISHVQSCDSDPSEQICIQSFNPTGRRPRGNIAVKYKITLLKDKTSQKFDKASYQYPEQLSDPPCQLILNNCVLTITITDTCA